jgi:hypothetical protein
MKYALVAIAVFLFTVFLYWLGGGDFERGSSLAVTVGSGAGLGLIAANMLATFND